MHLNPRILAVMHLHDVLVAGQLGKYRNKLFPVSEIADASITQVDFAAGKALPHKLGLFGIAGVEVARLELFDCLYRFKPGEALLNVQCLSLQGSTL
jgi:hypothetical protein